MHRALIAGQIHTEMEARDVMLLRSAKATRTPAGRSRPARSDEQIEQEIASTLRGWWQRCPHKRDFLLDEVHALAGVHRGPGGDGDHDGDDADDDEEGR